MGDSSSIRTAWFAGEKRDSATFWGPPVEFWMMPVAPKKDGSCCFAILGLHLPFSQEHSRLGQNSNSNSLPQPSLSHVSTRQEKRHHGGIKSADSLLVSTLQSPTYTSIIQQQPAPPLPPPLPLMTTSSLLQDPRRRPSHYPAQPATVETGAPTTHREAAPRKCPETNRTKKTLSPRLCYAKAMLPRVCQSGDKN